MAQATPTQATKFEKLTIWNLDESKDVDIKQGSSLQYWENLFSPTVTAKILVTSSINVLGGQGLYYGLKLKGGEKVEIHFSTPIEQHRKKDGVFKLTLYVNGISDYVQEKQMESFTLSLVSKEGITNLNKRVLKKYKAKKISEIIKDFLDMIECEDIDGEIETTANTYNFIGNMRKPLTIVPMLAARGIPEGLGSGSAGFFLWQTRKGMRFRSIENICKQKKVEENVYFFDRENKPLVDPEKSHKKILTYEMVKNNNLMGAQMSGEYSTYRIYFNPNTHKFTSPEEAIFIPQDDNEQTTLGADEKEISEDVNPKKIPKPEMAHRIVSGVYSVGTLEEKVEGNEAKDEVNMDQMEDVAQTISRYNSIFTQILRITVPCNTDLCAGDVIECQFPQVTEKDEYDSNQSGLYIIKELTHYFDQNRSYTAMKIIRDTSGYQKGN